MIGPHGGRLVNRLASGEKAAALEAEARELPVMLSGTQVRAVLRDGGQLPPEFTRPEVAEALYQAFRQEHIQQEAACS